jgi:arylsulfatase A-like enzyme
MTIDKTMVLKRDLKVYADYEKDDVYARLDPERKKIVKAYYDKISKDFVDKKLTGKALVEWKFQRFIRDYLSTANSLDRNIGKVLDYVDKHDLKNNTVIIYASDQGFYMGEHGWFDKRFIYEQSLKTPFLIRYPGVITPGTKINELVSNIDWAPTVLDLAKSKVPSDMQGKSFVPLFNKATREKANWRKAAYYHYYEFPQPHHVYPHFGVRTDRYTLVRFYGTENFWELYDLKTDPNELKNIYGQKQVAGLTQQLKKQLDELIAQYKDVEAAKILSSEK